MFRRSIPERGGLLLVQTRDNRMDASIHMFFMYLDLAVVWINHHNQVVDVRPAYRWRSMLVPARPARYVLELPISRLNDFRVGDYVKMDPIPVNS